MGPTGGFTGPTGPGPTGTSGPTGAYDAGVGPTGADPEAGPLELSEPWSSEDVECTPSSTTTCADIPVANRYTTIGGSNQTPTITWSAGPEGTQSYAITFVDLNDDNVQWVMWNIPASELSIGPNSIPEAASQAALIGASWLGPDACDNTYELVVYAVAEDNLSVEAGAQATSVYNALQSDERVLAKDVIRLSPHDPL